MRHAPGAGVGFGHVRNFGRGAGVEQMQKGKRGLAGFINSEKAVPERASGDCGDMQADGMHLPMQFIQAIDGVLRQLVGIHLDAAVGRRLGLIGELGAVPLDLARFRVKKQRAHRGAADVQADDKGIVHVLEWRTERNGEIGLDVLFLFPIVILVTLTAG